MPDIFAQKQWWDLRGEDLGNELQAIGQSLWLADEPRRVEAERNLRRFGGKQIRGLFQGRDPAPDADNARLNITKSVTETLVAKVGSNRPRPKVLTSGADFSLRRRTKQLQRFLDGIFKACRVYEKIPLMFRDALLTQGGVMNFYVDYGKRTVAMERVFPLEILVDFVEGVNGNPQNMWRVKFLDKGVLQGMFPDRAREIEDLAPLSYEDLPDFVADRDQVTGIRSNRMVKVFEAIHLAHYTLDGKKVDGRRAIVAGQLLLHECPWGEDYFPYEFFFWNPPVRGFWGDSAVGEIRGLEKEVNRLLQKVQRAMRLVGQPWIMNPRGSKVKPAKITNETALILDYDGPTPPTVQTFQPIHPQILEQLWTLQSKAYAQLGTNELQASATKPPGIDSGRGLEQLSEEHLVRFKHISKSFEDLVACNFARQFLRCARELDEWLKSNGHPEGYVIRAHNNKTMLKISWADAEISPDDFFLEPWPTSVLPITPSGRTEEVERWQANGWIDPQRAQTLLEFPDLDSEINLTTADTELLEWQLEQMLEDGKEIFPEPIQDLDRARKRGMYAVEHALIDGTPPGHIDRLRDFLNAVEEMLHPPAPPPDPNAPLGPPPMPPMGPDPTAMGGGLPPGMPPMPPGMTPPGMPPLQ